MLRTGTSISIATVVHLSSEGGEHQFGGEKLFEPTNPITKKRQSRYLAVTKVRKYPSRFYAIVFAGAFFDEVRPIIGSVRRVYF